MGWSNSTFQLLIITASPAGFSGLFVYSPAPGSGNLVASIASSAGTDPYGNAYQAGITSYGSAISFAQLSAAVLKLQDTAGVDWAVVAFRASGVPYLALQNQAAPVAAFISQAGNLVAAQPGTSFTPETWHNIALVGGQFGVSGVLTPQYRYEAIGGGRVFTRGVVALLANQISGATIGTVAAGWRPPGSRFFLCPNQLSGSVNANTTFGIDNTGTMTLQQAGSTGNTFGLDGLSWDIA